MIQGLILLKWVADVLVTYWIEIEEYTKKK